MKRKNLLTLAIALFSTFALPLAGKTQHPDELSRLILAKDSLFWLSYNNCDTTGYERFFTNDVEFYHDKGGTTMGVSGLALSIKKNLCSNSDFRIRRQAIEGSLQVFPLKNAGQVYGAILSGEHVFYILEKGKPARLDGRARFTHLWLLKSGDWKMARILSYDHGPAAER
jgi:hypothetical protein